MTVVLEDSSLGSHYINSRLGVWTPKLGSSRIVGLMEQITRKVPDRIVHILPFRCSCHKTWESASRGRSWLVVRKPHLWHIAAAECAERLEVATVIVGSGDAR